ncbi:thiopeptide-type bacteriocin biosynthesis protein [Paenibacillus sp. P26]|nr:thiopeptide-type bacteriocin biosynthesis protein [Paenibacillus sp. P26]UUZ94175.1 thiopeptide-type bacteriocin biosynthesis protein [Paenibacillus sp. P25]
MIVPFVREPQAVRKEVLTRASSGIPKPSSGLSFPPGSRWLYLKIYTGSATADTVLQTLHQHVIEEAVKAAWINQWFFIRYGDPDWHLRIRLHGSPEMLYTCVLPKIKDQLEPLMLSGRVSKWTVDTYEPEYVRYGGEHGLPLAERFFYADSEAVSRVVALYQGSASFDSRWRLALAGIDRLLDSFGLDLHRKREIVETCSKHYASEFLIHPEYKKAMGAKFRSEREGLEQLLFHPIASEHPLYQGVRVLRQGKEAFNRASEELYRAERQGPLTSSVHSLVPSLIHMHVNRIIRTSQRAHELLLYEFLRRLYESAIQRGIVGKDGKS